jgi:hypothetical protein
MPLDEGGQDDLQKDVLDITKEELEYWEKRKLSPNYIYDSAESNWESYIC